MILDTRQFREEMAQNYDTFASAEFTADARIRLLVGWFAGTPVGYPAELLSSYSA